MERTGQNAGSAAMTEGEPECEQQRAYIIDLADVRERDLPLVGTKAYHLGLLQQAGFPVPKGFCITTHAFRESVSTGQDDAVVIPPPLQEAILDVYRQARIAVAVVRSSAIEEDRPEASWAGIFPTTLHVITGQELLAAIEKCFRSLYGNSASLYRKHIGNGGRPGTLGMAVLVQETVDADAAGVLFTMNPLTGDRREMCINAVPGIGEPLLSGEVTGDAFTVTQEGQLLQQQISEKPNMLSTVGAIPVPENKRRWPTISSQRIMDLVEAGREVEKYFGRPQDIEFAVSKGRICIIQARPIPVKHPKKDNDANLIDTYISRQREKLQDKVATMKQRGELCGSDAIFSAGNITELLPTPTPMSFGLFRYIFAGEEGAILTGRRLLGYRLQNGAIVNLFELICGHPYFNLEIDATTYDIGVPIDIQNYLDQIRDKPSLANYPELGLYEQTLTQELLIARYGETEGERYYRIYSAFRGNIETYGKRLLREFPDRIEPEFQSYLERERQIDYSTSSPQDLVETFKSLSLHLRNHSCVQFVIAARLGFLFTEIVRIRLLGLFGQEAGTLMFSKLLQGLEGSRITQQSINLENLAHGRLSPGEFLSEYGHLAPNELEISAPRYADDPGNLEQLLQDVRASGRGSGQVFREQVQNRKSLEEEVRQKLHDMGKSEGEIDCFFSDLQIAQASLPLRETIKYYFAAEYALVRNVLLALAGQVGLEPDDIFYLYPEELTECLIPLDPARVKIKRRQEERRLARILAQENRMPSVIFGSDLGVIGRRTSISTSRQIRGLPVSPGEAAGIVRILDAETLDLPLMMQELNGQEIIVMRSANLGVAALFRKAAGLIIEIGGFLAHSACQARESGIPAVIIEGATVLLRDGMRVEVNGDTGMVSLIEDECGSQ